ncbi:G-type lectin S-receptor serine/threonine-protein kinase RLK1 [Spatholobus suberectus]|nr:G-type lectin S-receptor serine/threonine-protein kinase RLK1 [Spatholobus suberectus]
MLQPTWLFSFLVLTLQLSASGINSATFTLVNRCNYTVWPALLSSGSGVNATLSTTGFLLTTGQSSAVTAPATWTGRIWGRTLCTTDSALQNFSCVTGDCGTGTVECGGSGGSPPATLVEFSTGGSGGLDFYDVSLGDGFNVPVKVVPDGGNNCGSVQCSEDVNAVCPAELKVLSAGGKVVACKSACAAFNSSEYCDKPNAYSQIFKKACPQAYSYSLDDNNTVFTCPTPADYNVVFCPAASEFNYNNASSRSVGDLLIAGNGTTRWLSPSGDFAFGFYQLLDELFLLAIWYDQIPNRTIIWYANGDNLAPVGSKLELNDSHGLVLSNPQGLKLWRSNFMLGTINSGLMNDDGNFQLLDQNFVSLWESFSHPTDTLVPTQVVELNGELSSRQGEFNFSHGRFKLHLQEDGNVVLNLINLLSNYSYEPYYDTGIVDAKNQTNDGMKLIFDKLGFLYILTKSGEKFNITKPNEMVSTNGIYYKATINYDGVFTISYYPKDPKNGQRWVTTKTIPENICLNSTFTNGEGVCGFNSLCNLKDDQRPMCNCPEGYSLIDSNNMYGGCIPNFQVVCQGGERLGSQDDYIMKELQNTDWPKSDYETLSPCSLKECTESCLQDCLCVLVTFNGSSCWKKKLPLTNGRRDQGVNGTSIIKLMKNNHFTSFSNPHDKKDHDALIVVISVLLGSSVLVILMLVGAICFGFSCNRKKMKGSITNKSVVDKKLHNFTFKELVEATSNFREELGRGSFSIVYKGTIEMTSVAVKKLDKLFQDNDKEFHTEVNVIGQTHHRNLVRLLGYCNEGQHRILVYEFMSNGTLASFLFTPLKSNWGQRFHIALGIARGLVYLHGECCTQIIHCDIKPQNILLDDQYNAKISDFGLAKLLLINQSHTETGIRGTKGYVAPDWFRSAPITVKVDTYSFGVLLLEIICCRRNVEKELVNEERGILTDWAYDCYKTKRLDILLENDEEAINDIKSFEKLVMVAIWCIHEDPSLRPTMKKVLLMLEGIVEVSTPPSPYLCSSIS